MWRLILVLVDFNSAQGILGRGVLVIPLGRYFLLCPQAWAGRGGGRDKGRGGALGTGDWTLGSRSRAGSEGLRSSWKGSSASWISSWAFYPLADLTSRVGNKE